jgi:N-acetylglucosaminyldiphosphoundecaprenol N-acetyl-beta-D-mannosaminyltransferase
MNILGIKISEIEKSSVLNKINEFLNGSDQRMIVTPNPEIILSAMNDEELFIILNKADLRVPDGFGLKLAGWTMFKNLQIYPGADLSLDILKIAQSRNLKTAIINWSDGLSKSLDINSALSKNYPGLNFLVIDSERDFKKDENFDILKLYTPDILFCAFGSPFQEKYVFHALKNLPEIKLGIGVGASFDYISGKAKRAPSIMRKTGLEWLWRFFGSLSGQTKNRKKRIFRAVFVFPFKFFIWRFILPFKYRRNVACFLYKKVNSSYKVLLVERDDEPGHWQIVQGGIKGRNIEKEGLKELSEELNTDKFKPVKVFAKTCKYRFGSDISGKINKMGQKAEKHSAYKGQKQSLFIAEFLGKDEDIRLNHWDHSAWKWVKIEDFLDSVHPCRKKIYKNYLEKFCKTVSNNN